MESFELNTLQQGSLSVEEFYNNLRDLMIRDGVIEPAVITKNRFVYGVRKEIAQLLPHRCKCLFTLLYHAKQIEEKLSDKEEENDPENLSDKEEENEKRCKNEKEELCSQLCKKMNEGEVVENPITFILSSLQDRGCDSSIENRLDEMTMEHQKLNAFVVLLCQVQGNMCSLTFYDEDIQLIRWEIYSFPFDRGKCDSRTNHLKE